MILERVVVGSLQVNCYILAFDEGRDAIIIDPGDDEKKIREVLNKHKLTAGLLINTHSHFDHIGCDDKFGLPVYIHKADASSLSDPERNLSCMFSPKSISKVTIRQLQDKEKISFDGIELEVIHTPGHSSGSICLLLTKPENNILFSGDTLFYRGVGRTDFPGADGGELISSIENRLFALSEETIVYPGHGPSTTIGGEKKGNPFLT